MAIALQKEIFASGHFLYKVKSKQTIYNLPLSELKHLRN